MEHVFIGMGYVAGYLASLLNQEGILPITVSRQAHDGKNIRHICHDVSLPGLKLPQDYVLYYFVPPNNYQEEDEILKAFLTHLHQKPKKIIYIGSSGIYGEHHGAWVDEDSACHIETPRQKGRASAELLFKNYSQTEKVPCALLRVAGIYGPNRLPIQAIEKNSPVIAQAEAPAINHIYVKDLARILSLLGGALTYHGLLNIADGDPRPMGYLQSCLQALLGYPPPPIMSFDEAFSTASAMKKEFMTQNKKLSIQRLNQLLLPQGLTLTPIKKALLECLAAAG